MRKKHLRSFAPISDLSTGDSEIFKGGDNNKHTPKKPSDTKISAALPQNKDAINHIFSTDINFDFVIRDFKVRFRDKYADAFLIFYDGLTNAELVNRDIMAPLMSIGAVDTTDFSSLEECVYECMLSQAPNSKKYDMQDVVDLVGFGNCAVFVDGCTCCFVADVKGWSKRGVDRPVTEAVLSGPQEAFCETIMANIALVRKILKDPKLIAEKIPVGTRSKTPCALMYIDGITNPRLVEEARHRLLSIDTQYIFSSADVEMMIEDSTLFPLPQLLKTERPDRAAAQLCDGKVLIVVQGSPFVLILPASLKDLAEASEDNYVRVAEANFMRFVRLVGCFLALFLPGIFLSIVLYHHESIPTDLLFAIEASREQMPFPTVIELLIMILSFELIKEAAVRVPDPVGSTLGIVGGLILGQSAVSAGIASPLLIIIVSIAALGSFTAPSISVSRAISLIQLLFVILGYLAGFLGIAVGVFCLFCYMSRESSFGVSYLAPSSTSENPFFIVPIWMRELRPKSLFSLQLKKQPHISRKWKGDE